MDDLKKVYSKNKDIVTRQIDDELILMPLYKNNTEINKMYTLNQTAAQMWELIDGKRDVLLILDELVGQYEKVSKEELESDLREFIEDMKGIKAVL